MTAVRRLGWWVLGGTLVVVGVLVAVLTQPASVVSEFSYLTYDAPDAAMGSSLGIAFDGAALVSWWQLGGAALAVLGLLVLVGRAAYLLGRRSNRA